MKPSYLIDTDWVIHYLNGQPEIVTKLNSLRVEGLAVSIVSLAELYEGVYSSTDPAGNEEGLKNFLSSVVILGIDEEICKIFGKKRGSLRKEGKLVSDFDLLIASTCLSHNLILLTNNRKHFEMVEDLRFFL